jgi:predicted RNase H-like nuclease (RuvC/YqgF family)
MDLATPAAVVTAALTALGALSVAFRERARRAALQAEKELESERQETTAQEHTLARLKTLETRMDQQSRLIEDLREENMLLRKHAAKQDDIIQRQAGMIGHQARTIKAQAVQIEQLEEAVARKDRDNAALAREMDELRVIIRGSRDKPSGLPEDLYVPLPRPPKLPKV